MNTYHAGVDTSGLGGGPQADAFTLTIAHMDVHGIVIVDLCRGWKKSRTSHIDLSGIVGEIARILQSYRITEVVGDRYGAQWVVEAFAKEGISYRQSEEDKSYYYLNIEPLFAQNRVELLDHPQLVRELRLLERTPRPGGRTVVDHPRGAHDDFANSFAIAATLASRGGLGLAELIEANRLAPERTVRRDLDWLDQDASDDLHPVDRLLDNSRRGGWWDL
jgi:hypothetical protein